jgi:ribonuclease-3
MDNLEKIFSDSNLYLQSLTHKSWVNEHPGVRKSNERLEFLGDAVLEFIVSSHIYEKFPEKEEGYLTALRANLVNTVNLAEIAKSLELGKKIYMSKGEEETGGRDNPSILADTVEAVIGAIYLDLGLDEAIKFIGHNLLSQVKEKIKEPLKDPKSLLQELVQSHAIPAPRYEVVKEEGPDHAKTFTVEVKFDSKKQGVGSGKNKSEAEQEAAKAALISYPNTQN